MREFSVGTLHEIHVHKRSVSGLIFDHGVDPLLVGLVDAQKTKLQVFADRNVMIPTQNAFSSRGFTHAYTVCPLARLPVVAECIDVLFPHSAALGAVFGIEADAVLVLDREETFLFAERLESRIHLES